MAYGTRVESAANPDVATPRASVESSNRWLIIGYVVTAILVLGPLVRMTGVVLRSSKLQHSDYWTMLPRFTNPDGGLDFDGLFHFHNEHPMVVPQFLYWLNLRIFSGSNITLGVVVLALVVGQLVVVALLLWQSAFRPVERMALFIVASALLFDLIGAWNFARAMSGTAWFSANLFAITAVYLRSRDRRWSAFAVAVLAAVSYGTGIAVWPAVFATGVSGRPIRQWWREWPYAAGFAATFVWYQLSAPDERHPLSEPHQILRGAASMLGFVLGADGTLGELIGYVALIGVPMLVIGLGRLRREAGVAGWIGVATFGWLATLELFVARSVAVGDQNRYSSLAALTWIGFAALAIYALHEVVNRRAAGRRNASVLGLASPWVALAIVVPLLVGAVGAGRAHASAMHRLNPMQELREIALHLGLTDNTRYLYLSLGGPSHVTDLLIATGHYPFVDSWDLDCGLLGAHLDVPRTGDEPAIAGEMLSGHPEPRLPGAVEITGRVIDDRPIHCIIVTNDENQVVGAGTTDADRHSGTRIRALAPSGDDTYRVYVILDQSPTPLLLGTLRRNEIEPT